MSFLGEEPHFDGMAILEEFYGRGVLGLGEYKSECISFVDFEKSRKVNDYCMGGVRLDGQWIWREYV